MPALRSVNKVILVGNLTRDAEVNFTASGTAICVFTVATNRAWKDANGESHEDAAFHRVNAWGKFGENIAKILTKGLKVYVEGELTYREIRDAEGKLTSKDARIRAESVIILERGTGHSASHEELAASQGDTEIKGGDFDLDAIAQGLDEAKAAAKPATSAGAKPVAATPVADDDLPF